jgi:hypothetical protein
VRGTQLGKFLVLHLDDLGGGIVVLAIPERIDGEHLHVDCLRVHPFETLFDDDEMLFRAFDPRQDAGSLVSHQSDRFVEVTVRVHIDRLDSLAVDHHGQTLRLWRLRTGRGQHSAAAKNDTSRAACPFEKAPPGGHALFSMSRIDREL